MEGRFSLLPEECISEVLSRTSPLDVVRSAVISSGFRSASESDGLWDKFLPPDYHEIISRSIHPVFYPTKKDLYTRLCNSYILLDDGKLSFSLDKESGKKCFMIRADEILISWGDTPQYWKWKSSRESRFGVVAELKLVCWLDLRGKIKTQMLSCNTTYSAYLVFKLARIFHGLDSAKSYVRFVGETIEDRAEEEASEVCLEPSDSSRQPLTNGTRSPTQREDGWMEIELGEFYNDGRDNGEVEMRLIEITQLHGKSGLIVEGMELRPKHIA